MHNNNFFLRVCACAKCLENIVNFANAKVCGSFITKTTIKAKVVCECAREHERERERAK